MLLCVVATESAGHSAKPALNHDWEVVRLRKYGKKRLVIEEDPRVREGRLWQMLPASC